MIGSRAWGSIALMGLLVGCGGPQHHLAARQTAYLGWGSAPVLPAGDQPLLDLSDEEVEEGLGAEQELEHLRNRLMRAELEQTPAESLEEAAQELARAYWVGADAVAEELLAEHPGLLDWERAGELLEITANFSAYGGTIDLDLQRRPHVQGALAVAIPPGTYGTPTLADARGEAGELDLRGRSWTQPEAERRYGDWPPAQDLAFLRAPVIFFPAERARLRVKIPVACAAFRMGAPRPGQPYELRRFPADSACARLLRQLCRGELPDEAEAQLAIWLARDDVSWDEFRAEGGVWGRLVTFRSNSAVLPAHAAGAARLILRSGLDPRGLRFFDPEAGETPAPLEPPPAAEPPTQEPAAPEPVPAAPQEAPREPEVAPATLS